MTSETAGKGHGLSAAQRLRYARQVMLPGFGITGQERLIGSRVLVVGAGGLGSVIAPYLAAAGVGTIGIVDDDVVDESNLHRQLLHDTADIGIPKVESAAARLAAINPLVRVDTHAVRLTATNAVELLAGYDLVVDGADNFATRYVVADAAALTGRPHVWGSILRFDGQVSVWWPPYGPCYRCVFPSPPPAGSVASCAEAGVLGSICAAVGAMQASEAIKLLAGIGEPLVGRLLVHDALAATWSEVRVRPDPGCRLCGVDATITVPGDAAAPAGRGAAGPAVRLSVADVATLARDPGVLVIDVRNPAEWEGGVIEGARLVPLDRLATEDLPHDRRIVLYCAAGGRSAAGARILAERGYADVADLVGGITAWQVTQPTVAPASGCP